jgi:thioredoxin-related protein
MKKSLLILLAIITIASSGLAQKKQNITKKTDKEEFKWYTFEEAYALNQKNPKKIFVDIYTDWCGWCVKMDNTTWNDSIIKDFLSQNFYPVKLNAERKDTVRYNGNTYVNPSPEVPRSTHQLAVALLQGQMSYPSYVILNEKFEILNMLKGYKVAKDMEVLLHYIAENAFDKMTYEKYSESFTGAIK